ncbi:adenylate cyclase [Candidatus Symbiobacter mobilis CR]|uniref:Adenylate cyclase n=2 Tax=Candidatus Symbiobacter TaxID=1436289 RepID=U5N929_9BURK|nr:adenylate cyclase [Candidatus Symbiobacter mobilis CR]
MVPIVLALLHVLGWVEWDVLRILDAWAYDVRLGWSMSQTRDPRIVIVDIDEKSLSQIGRWPWSRNKMAQLTGVLCAQQVAAIGFDVVFAEPDQSSGIEPLRRLAQREGAANPDLARHVARLAPELDYDGLFAQALHRCPVVLGYYFSGEPDARPSGVLPAPVVHSATKPPALRANPAWRGYGASIATLAQAAPLGGFFNSITDRDGVVRSLPMLTWYEGRVYESLPLSLYRLVTGMPAIHLDAEPGATLTWETGTVRLPLDERGTMAIPFRGKGGARGGTFEYVSAADVLAGAMSPKHLQGKIVLVGTSAPGIVDLRATPVAAVYPGVEVQASMLSGLLDQRFLRRPMHMQTYDVLLMLFVGLGLAWALPRMRAPVAVAVCVLTALTLVILHTALFLWHGWIIDSAAPLTMVLSIFILNMGYGYLVASRSRRELVELFGTYVPRELVREMVQDPDNYSMRARNEELTVMFCDMRGFTTLAERLDPLALQRFLNGIFTELTNLIGANRGTVDKYMGDCIMAFWGAPVPSPLHAQLAVKTAIQMVQALGLINERQRQASPEGIHTEIGVGIGLNTGQMYVGDMGSNIRRSYTVIGDAVNLGSRLEGLSKIYGVSIVVSESTRLLGSNYAWQELDLVRVKGKAQAIAIFTPVCEASLLTQADGDRIETWRNFLDRYRRQDWKACTTLLASMQPTQRDAVLIALYADRVAQRSALGFDFSWDGVTNFDTK